MRQIDGKKYPFSSKPEKSQENPPSCDNQEIGLLWPIRADAANREALKTEATYNFYK